MGWLMAAELRARGVDLSFAPCVDLDYGVNEVIGDRAFHKPARSGRAQLAVAYMHGMRDAGMAATAKHFPGHGAVVADSHLALPVDRRELVDLTDDLAPYRRLIANGLPAVMVAHMLFPAVDAAPRASRPLDSRRVARRAAFPGGSVCRRSVHGRGRRCLRGHRDPCRAGACGGLRHAAGLQQSTQCASSFWTGCRWSPSRPRACAWCACTGGMACRAHRADRAHPNGRATSASCSRGLRAAPALNWTREPHHEQLVRGGLARASSTSAPEGIVVCDATVPDHPGRLCQRRLLADVRLSGRRAAGHQPAHPAGQRPRPGGARSACARRSSAASRHAC